MSFRSSPLDLATSEYERAVAAKRAGLSITKTDDLLELFSLGIRERPDIQQAAHSS